MVKELFIAVLEGLHDLKRGRDRETAAVGAFLSFQAKQKNSTCMRSKWSTQCKHCIERNQGCLSYHLFIIYYCRDGSRRAYNLTASCSAASCSAALCSAADCPLSSGPLLTLISSSLPTGCLQMGHLFDWRARTLAQPLHMHCIQRPKQNKS